MRLLKFKWLPPSCARCLAMNPSQKFFPPRHRTQTRHHIRSNHVMTSSAATRLVTLPMAGCLPQERLRCQVHRVFVGFSVSHHFIAISVNDSLGNENVPAEPRHNLGPNDPIHCTENKDGDANQREGIIRVSVGVPVAVGRDEWCECEENVEKQVGDCDKQVRFPGRRPVL